MNSIGKGSNLEADLKTRLRGIVVVAGVGNTLRADDGAGPRLVEMLREELDKVSKPPSFFHLIDCGETPENYIGSIAQLRPDTVVVVDSASLGLPAGEIRLIKAGDLLERSLSTHGMSPALIMNRLKEETGADVFMLAVQPDTTTFDEDLSVSLEYALTELAGVIERVIERRQREAGS